MDKRRVLIDSTIKLSRLLIVAVTGEPRVTVYPLIQMTKEDEEWKIALLDPSFVALHLSLKREATDDMASCAIDGGKFVKLSEEDKTGRLEFRRLPESNEGTHRHP